MDRSQEFQPEGTFKTGHKIRDSVESLASLRLVFKKFPRLIDRARHQLQVLLRRVSPIPIARNHVAFYGMQKVSQIIGIGAVGCGFEAEAQGLAGDLHEVEELVDFEQGDKRIQ